MKGHGHPAAAATAGSHLDFLRGFLLRPKEVASVVPSSPALGAKVAEAGGADRARVVVELGPGTGPVTRELLRRMAFDARLVAIERNPLFVRRLREAFDDPRLTIWAGDAQAIARALAAAGERQADLVVSGLPFPAMGERAGRIVLEAIRGVLAPHGRFVAYQLVSEVRRWADPLFGPPEVRTVFRNLPPLRVFTWRREPPARSA
ncbi:MAG TPA: methyltransferase domain-containing protein [Thermoanaerobaculia bacterium]|nr:methyltransferase domain-containing protein [Thermoanaerobaculia bacterium]